MDNSNTDQEIAEEIIAEAVLGADETDSSSNPLIFLHDLSIDNFRSIKSAKFNFQPGLNVIIGENNAAKTAVIDALRIVLNLGSFEKKEDFIRLKSTDVYLGGTQPDHCNVSFKATFYVNKDSDLPAQFYDMLSLDDEIDIDGETYLALKLAYTVSFEMNKPKGRYEVASSELKGGQDYANPVSYETLDFMRSVYLAPLRDLINDRSRVGAEIERLILSHTPLDKDADRQQIPEKLKSAALELIKDVTDNNHEKSASKSLTEYAKPYNIQEDSLSFVPSGISEELFRTLLPVFTDSLHGLDKLPLSSNGLGINQLIYASIVLSRRGDTDSDAHIRKFFLIEEPEAHLHPQLQDSFFYALNQVRDHQIFVTSHSPTITAKTDLEKIIIMRRDQTNSFSTPVHLSKVFDGKENDKRYLHKFLDVTRSQLLFAKAALFVEGVTEAMLLQTFSESIDRSLRDNAVEIVIIDSDEGYEHFRPLFDNSDGAYSRAVFLTDSDIEPSLVKSDSELKSVFDPSFDLELEVNDNTAIATGYGTFEFCLVRTAGNEIPNVKMQDCLKKALIACAKVGLDKQDAFIHDFLDFEKPSLSYRKMKEKRQGAHITDAALWYGDQHTNSAFKSAKSDFAFYLNDHLASLKKSDLSEAITLPKYIEDAIRFVVPSEQDDSEQSHSDEPND